MAPNGLFISFEGIDGAGKSSHIAALADAFRAQARSVVCTREPGGTPLAEKLRALLLRADQALRRHVRRQVKPQR